MGLFENSHQFQGRFLTVMCIHLNRHASIHQFDINCCKNRKKLIRTCSVMYCPSIRLLHNFTGCPKETREGADSIFVILKTSMHSFNCTSHNFLFPNEYNSIYKGVSYRIFEIREQSMCKRNKHIRLIT